MHPRSKPDYHCLRCVSPFRTRARVCGAGPPHSCCFLSLYRAPFFFTFGFHSGFFMWVYHRNWRERDVQLSVVSALQHLLFGPLRIVLPLYFLFFYLFLGLTLQQPVFSVLAKVPFLPPFFRVSGSFHDAPASPHGSYSFLFHGVTLPFPCWRSYSKHRFFLFCCSRVHPHLALSWFFWSVFFWEAAALPPPPPPPPVLVFLGDFIFFACCVLFPFSFYFVQATCGGSRFERPVDMPMVLAIFFLLSLSPIDP